ncbi:MAG: hypothetical protein ABSG57_05975 [Candidatus Bathyarchaeia archaeon]
MTSEEAEAYISFLDAFRQGKRVGDGARAGRVRKRTKEGDTIIVVGAGNTLGIE